LKEFDDEKPLDLENLDEVEDIEFDEDENPVDFDILDDFLE